MTLEERLLAIQAEYRTAVSEADMLKRQAVARTPDLQDALKRVRNAGESEDLRRRTEQLAEEIARQRDRADAISERAGELKAQITEIEAHLRQRADAGKAEIISRINELRQTIMHLRSEEERPGSPDTEDTQAELMALQKSMEQLRADYLRNRVEALVSDYLATAQQLVEMGAQLMALCTIAAKYGNPIELRPKNLEIPLPSGDLASQWGFETENLRIDDQHIHDAQASLNNQLAAILRS